jgi:dGTPase
LAVRDGIVNHCGEDKSTELAPVKEPDLNGKSNPVTIEGCVVKLVDKIAYLGRDLEDAVVAGLINESEVPGEIVAIIGNKNGEIVDYFVKDLMQTSESERIALSPIASELMGKLMKFNYDCIYKNKKLGSYEDRVKDVLDILFVRFMDIINEYDDRIDHYLSNSLKVIKVLGKYIGDRNRLYFHEEAGIYANKELRNMRIVTDFMSTLTDNFVFQACSEYFLPKPII